MNGVDAFGDNGNHAQKNQPDECHVDKVVYPTRISVFIQNAKYFLPERPAFIEFFEILQNRQQKTRQFEDPQQSEKTEKSEIYVDQEGQIKRNNDEEIDNGHWS